MHLNAAPLGASLHWALSRGGTTRLRGWGYHPLVGEGGPVSSADRDIADIDFDDLTSPRLTDVQRQILEFTEARPVELDIDRMLAEAIDRAGVCDDLDDTDDFG